MKIWYFYFKILLIVITCFSNVHASENKIIVTFEDYFNKLTTLEADFTEHTKYGYAVGKLYLSKKQGIKLDYLDPYRRSITSNGRETIYTDHELEESSSGWIENPLISILLNSGNKKIHDEFTVLNSKTYETYFEIILSPKNKELHEMMKSIRIVMAKSNNEITKIETINSVNEKVMIALKNMQRGVNFKRNLFSLQPPGFFSDWGS